ncbi:MAG: alpha/beta fold hydrolase [Acidimicrobiales bacterium]
MPKVRAGGYDFFYQRMGQGESTVVFIHGLVMDNLSSWWYTVANQMAKHADVICYDLRGHGLSDRPESGYQISDAVEDLKNILAALDLRRPVHIVGNSYGGVVGLATASTYRDLVESLVLIEAHAAVDEHSERKRNQLVHGLDLAGLLLTSDELARWLEDAAGRKMNRMARSARTLIYDTTMVDDLRDSRPFTPTELKAIDCPTLLIYGENSDIADRGELLVNTLPRARLCVIPGVDHSVLMEATRSVRDLITGWILNGGPASTNGGPASTNGGPGVNTAGVQSGSGG